MFVAYIAVALSIWGNPLYADGACCRFDGCLDAVDPETCALISGSYAGDDTLCDDYPCQIGSCCTPIGCIRLPEFECYARDDWTDWYNNSCNWCPRPRGACCFPDVCVPDVPDWECDRALGDWPGALTDCTACPECDGPDFDGDGKADACDPDIDNDGVMNELDECDYTPAEVPHWLMRNGTFAADINGDCTIDLLDFREWQLVLSYYPPAP